LKPTFCNVTFVSNMCQVYSIKEKIKIILFSFLWIYNDLYVIASEKSISLKNLMKKYFWTPYWLIKFKSTCSLLLLFHFFSNFVFNLIQTPMKSTILSKWNSSKNWIYFFVVSWKTIYFLTWYFSVKFFCIKYHAFTYHQKFFIVDLWMCLVATKNLCQQICGDCLAIAKQFSL
jgi:hypothetical protein